MKPPSRPRVPRSPHSNGGANSPSADSAPSPATGGMRSSGVSGEVRVRTGASALGGTSGSGTEAVPERRRISSGGGSGAAGTSRTFDLEGTGSGKPRAQQSGRAGKPTQSGALVAPTTKSSSKVAVLSTGVADRLAEREAIELHDKRRKMWIFGSVFAVLGLLTWAFVFSSVFALRLSEVQVWGAEKYVTEQEVVDQIKPIEGTPLARLDMNGIHDAVAQIPNVKSVAQTRRWPNGVTITIVERAPVAAVPVEGEYALLDLTAVEVATVKKAPKDVPIVNIPVGKENEVTLTTVLEVLDTLPQSLLKDIKSIRAFTQDNIVFTLRDNLTVQWGNSAETQLKVQVLERLRPTALDEGKSTIDLSAPTFPIIR